MKNIIVFIGSPRKKQLNERFKNLSRTYSYMLRLIAIIFFKMTITLEIAVCKLYFDQGEEILFLER